MDDFDGAPALGKMSDKPVQRWHKLDFSKRASHRALRVAVYERDQYMCVECGAGALRPDGYDGRKALAVTGAALVYLHIDHIIPRSKGGAVDHVDNLQTLCEPCNLSKGARL